MKRRFNALVGSVTLFVATRLARRVARKKVDDVTPGQSRNGWRHIVPSKTKSAPQAVAERATTLVEAVRPVVQRAIADPELHAALRRAFDTGREVTGEVKGNPPGKVAKRLARDRKLQKRIETAATDLQKAVQAVAAEPKKSKGVVRRVIAPVLVVGGAAGAVFVFLRKRNGSQDTPY